MLKLLIQVAGVGLFVAGVALVSVPAAFIVAGIGTAAIAEVRL